jgi:hypothetical protein
MENFSPGILIFALAIAVFFIACKWKLYEKAGKPGWAAIVPIYDTLVMLEIIRKPWWWLILMMIPLVNIVFVIWALNLFVKAYGKSEGFTIGVLFLPYIFLPILAFDKKAQYIYGPSNEINEIGNPVA